MFIKILGIAILILLMGVLNPRLSIRADGTTIITSQASFYIASAEPKKVYIFNPKPRELEKIIADNISSSEATFGILIKNLSTGQEVSLNADESFTAASLYKLGVMYRIFERALYGELDIKKQDIKSNLEAMITVSSNEASYYLVENYTSWSQLTKSMHSIGLTNTYFNNPPTTTPKDMGKLLEMIAQGEAVSFDASVEMLKLLAAQKRNDRIPANLPEEAIVAHKTGELFDVRHDAGVVVSPENNYILVLMSKGSTYPESVKPIMAKISSEVYEFFKSQWDNPPEIL